MFPVPAVKPFRAVELSHGKGTTKPASRADAYALHRALTPRGSHISRVSMQPKPLGTHPPGPGKPFLLRTARARVRRAAKNPGLPGWLTLAACRHGGLTELGDAELTESGIIALSGHRTADAARGYVKRTEVQREAGLLKRRAWVQAVKEGARQEEQEVDKSRNRAPARE